MLAHPKELRISDFTYHLPDDKIALHPLPQRDAAQLLVYKEGHISKDQFVHLATHLPAKSLLVFNNTKVIPARLLFQKSTGGNIEVFALEPVANGEVSGAMAQAGSIVYKCLVKGVSKWKGGNLVKKKIVGNETLQLEVSLLSKEEDDFSVAFNWQPSHFSFAEILESFGEMPIPPYLHRQAVHEDAERYQTIYAQNKGSVAAPTAGLHFTPAVLQSLASAGIKTAFTTLHVGAGTFKPVKSTTLSGHHMHAEWISVEKELINHLLQNDSIIPVGTTSMRTLESLYWLGVKTMVNPTVTNEALTLTQWEVYNEKEPKVSKKEALQALIYWMDKNETTRLVTQTQILIAPGYTFRICKGLITNFHQPQSTLLLLIAALIGPKWKEVYQYALENNFRFLSYGDSSLLMNNEK